MKLDVLASEPHFIDHLASVWNALDGDLRGDFMVASGAVDAQAALLERARSHGIEAIAGPLPSGRPVLAAAFGDLNRARRAGRTRIALMEHGAGQSYGGRWESADQPSFAGGAGRTAELFLHPGLHPALRDRKAYPDAIVEVVGSPKLDDLPVRGPGPGPVVAVSFHFDSIIAPEARSAFVWFRRGLLELARAHKVIGHAHPRKLAQLAPWYARNGIEVVADFRDVCRRADVYVCDNSSTLYEFAATGRPVVVLEAPIYKVAHGLRFWDAVPGIQVYDERRLLETVEIALGDRPTLRATREAALDMVYAHRTGAAARASAVIGDWLARPAVASLRADPIEVPA